MIVIEMLTVVSSLKKYQLTTQSAQNCIFNTFTVLAIKINSLQLYLCNKCASKMQKFIFYDNERKIKCFMILYKISYIVTRANSKVIIEGRQLLVHYLNKMPPYEPLRASDN
jgi:hypothetical protein